MAQESTSTTITVTGRSEGPKRTTIETDARAGFSAIRAQVTVDTDAVQDWLAEVGERRPVADDLRTGTDVHVAVDRA